MEDKAYNVGDDPALDDAIIATLNELTPRWQSFAVDPMPETKRTALMRLVLCGFAQMKLAYKVTNSNTGEWLRLRFVVSGEFCSRKIDGRLVDVPVWHFIAALRREWFSPSSVMTPIPGVHVADEPHDWILAITDAGGKLRALPDNRWHVLNAVNCHNARAVVLKDGSETGRDIASIDPQTADAILIDADGCYTVNGASIAVSDNEDSVLQSFLERPAMDNTALVKTSGVDRAAAVLRGLRTKYDGVLAPFITIPGGKGKGGYAVKIRSAK